MRREAQATKNSTLVYSDIRIGPRCVSRSKIDIENYLVISIKESKYKVEDD